jgi:hypothetical protein
MHLYVCRHSILRMRKGGVKGERQGLWLEGRGRGECKEFEYIR